MILSSSRQKLPLATMATLSLGLGSIFIDFHPAQAADFSFRGNFATDDEVQLFNFSVETTSTITLETLSYGGGTQADGTVIDSGGFDPILTLFDGSGNAIAGNDDNPFLRIPDSLLTGSISPGNYTVALTQYDNFFLGSLGDNISRGFALEGNPNFTSIFGCSNGQFCSFNGLNRTNEWAFDVLNVETAVTVQPSANVPEPTSILSLFTIGTWAVVSLQRQKRN